MSRHLGVIAVLLILVSPAMARAEAPPEAFPRFEAPGEEEAMGRLRELFWLHRNGFTDCTLWDPWLPHGTLWASRTPEGAERARRFYRDVFLKRRIDHEGYVAVQQHRGLAHSDGWPFPTFQQAGGLGWYFSTAGENYLMDNFPTRALTSLDGWELHGATVEGFDPEVGLKLRIDADEASLSPPGFERKTFIAPYIRLEWGASGLKPEARPALDWRLKGEADWKPGRAVAMAHPPATGELAFADVPVHRDAEYDGMLARLRFKIDGAKGASVTLKSIITATDTRHPITNINFVRGSAEYFNWTGDVPFLRENVARVRGAMRYALKEFDVRGQHLVRVPWVGHSGRTGLSFGPNGEKTLIHGEGVGNNYWDLLPFGGDDGLATIYLYDALRILADLEAVIAAHPEWEISADGASDAEELRGLAASIKTKFGETFWLPKVGRFAGWRDRDGKLYDYGFVFVNTEAIAYGIATDEQARTVYDWLDGRRIVEGDTSQGADIYHWRFGPRSTTRRNVEVYCWVWSGPENIPWGGQVQDGGAVLGFSYFDVLSRLKVYGPDDAWARLKTITEWFGEVQAEGGYRAYYAKPGRGTLQGGGPAGGLGLDHEFMESILVPQSMLYGFLGVKPRGDGLKLDPRLPSGWPSLAVTGVHAQGHVLDLKATPEAIEVHVRATDGSPLLLELPAVFAPEGSPAKVTPEAGKTYRFPRGKS
ncbi:glycosyl hydrolase family 65 protein [Paludisphaera sp.]|uniref:glycosyl hydrolase family 65 protein n=1 Tax=Paludisphaera sp. TaxID=2017432 RepID=UPI00301E501B